MYTYPEALDALQKVAKDLFAAAGKLDAVVQLVPTTDHTASVYWSHFSGVLSATINMPVRPAATRMTEAEFDRWVAYMLHEVGHPLHTSRQTWDEAVRTGRQALLNSLEDVRIEKALIDSGIARNGKRSLERLLDQIASETTAGGFDPNDPTEIGWTFAALGRLANGYEIDLSDMQNKLDPKGPVAKVLAWGLPALGQCGSTQDCLDLADRIVDALPRNKPSKRSANSGEGEGEGKPQQQAGQQDQLEQADGQNSSSSPKKLSPRDVKQVDLRPKGDDDLPTGEQANIERRLIDILRDPAQRTGIMPLAERDADADAMASATTEVQKHGRLKTLVAKALKAEDHDEYEGGRSHGRLDRRAFGKAAAGSVQVFGKRTITQGYETDVEVLIDGSSSMILARRIHKATTLSMLIAQACSQVGVNCSVRLFTDYGLYAVKDGRKRPKTEVFASLPGSPCGGTPLSVNIIKAARLQAARASGKRRVLFAITDGGCDNGAAMVRAAVRWCVDALDTEMVNLHIGTMRPGTFPNEVAVDGDVASAGMEQMLRILERGAR